MFLQTVLLYTQFQDTRPNSHQHMNKTKMINKIPNQQQDLKERGISTLRERLKKQMISPKFTDGWSMFLQVHKKDTLHQSAPFKQAVKENRDFTCSICYNLMIFPVILPCGHAFCRPCIEQATLLQNRCCICRTPNKLQYFTVSKKINDIIMTIGLQQLGNEERGVYQKRYLDYIGWQHMTMIDTQFRIGDKVHFYDYTLMGWRYGVVSNVTVKKGVDVYLFIEPLVYTDREELLKKGYHFHYLSSRIAKCEFFFQRSALWVFWSRQSQNRLKDRDQELHQMAKRRTLDKSIRQRRPAHTLALKDLFSLTKNVMKYLENDDRFKQFDKIFNYTFRDFQEGVKIQRQFEIVIPFSMQDQSEQGFDNYYTSSFEN